MKKFLTILLTVVLTTAVAVTGTVAYLTYEDSNINVMTLGNVEIEQKEYERKEDGSLGEFAQNKPAYPAVGPIDWAANGVVVNGTEYKVFTEELKNVVDKIVTVKNTGKSDAYVRTIIAIEAPDFDPNDLIHINHNDDGVTMSAPVTVTVGGVQYVIFEFVYTDAVAANAESAPSLVQVFLDAKATNEDCEAFGETWEIIALSQAVQVEGFADAKTALDTAFGATNATNAAEWLEKIVSTNP